MSIGHSRQLRLTSLKGRGNLFLLLHFYSLHFLISLRQSTATLRAFTLVEINFLRRNRQLALAGMDNQCLALAENDDTGNGFLALGKLRRGNVQYLVALALRHLRQFL